MCVCVFFLCNPESEKQHEGSSNPPSVTGQFPLQSKQAASADKNPLTGVVVLVLGSLLCARGCESC